MSSPGSAPPTTTNCFGGWESYPANIDPRHPLLSSPSKSSSRLSKLAGTLFSASIDVRVIGIGAVPDAGVTLDSQQCKTANSLEDILDRDSSNRPRVRIISLHSKRTPSPLRITEAMMRKLLTAYKVGPEFLDVLFSFGKAPNLTESGSKNLTCRIRNDGSKDISYQLRFAEENHRQGNQPWSMRQMGVYHHQSASKNFDLFIVLNCSQDSAVEKQLWNMKTSSAARKQLSEDPCRFHFIPFSTHLDDWRWYLRYLGNNFFEKNEQIMTLELKMKHAEVNFDEVQGLRNLRDIILPLAEHFAATLGILQGLQAFHRSHFMQEWSLAPFEERLNDFSGDVSSLTGRIDNAIDTASYFLELKNQDTAASIDETMSELTKKTNKDTTSVRWITLLTLIYLPASFVSTLYGMNLFGFNSQTRRLVIANDFWIYPATLFPLMLLTFLGYRMLKVYHEIADEKDRQQRVQVFWRQTLWPFRKQAPISTQEIDLSSCASA